MRCPYRKTIHKCGDYTIEEFGECYKEECPFYEIKKSASEDNVLMMFDRFYQMCATQDQQTLVLNMKQAYLELPHRHCHHYLSK